MVLPESLVLIYCWKRADSRKFRVADRIPAPLGVSDERVLDGHFFEAPTKRIASRSFTRAPRISFALPHRHICPPLPIFGSLYTGWKTRKPGLLRILQFDSEVKFFAFPIRSANCIGRIQSAAAAGFALRRHATNGATAKGW